VNRTVLLLLLLVSARPGPIAAQSPAADSLRELALHLDEPALALEARDRPLLVREALAGSLERWTRGPDGSSDQLAAQRLATAFAVAWRDSFLLGEVARFSAWSAPRRAARLWTDSVRLAGVAAYTRDGPRTAIVVWRRGLARARAGTDSVSMATLQGNIGAGLLAEGRLDSAAMWLERSVAMAAAVGDRRTEANATGMLAAVAEDRGDVAAARDGYARAMRLAERIGDSRGMAAHLNNLGLLARDAGDADEARRRFEAALALNRQDARDAVAATNLVNLAGLASDDGNYARADSLYRDALATWRSRQEWANAADALRGLGQVGLRRGDYPTALQVLGEALDIYRRTGPAESAVQVQRLLAGARAAAGDLQGAVNELRLAQALADSAHASGVSRAGLLLARADLAAQLNNPADAEPDYAAAAALYRRVGQPRQAAEAEAGLATLLIERGDAARARAMLLSALRVQVAAADRRAASLTRLSLARSLLAIGDTAGARRQQVRAAADLDQLGDPVALAATLVERGAVEVAAGATDLADSLYVAALRLLGPQGVPEVGWRLHAGRAEVARVRHQDDAEARELRAALAELDRPTRSLTTAERRAAFLADKWSVYAELALLEQRRGRPGAAFETSERLRAREMAELLSLGAIGTTPDTGSALLAREGDLRRRIAELTDRVDGPDLSRRRGADLASVGPADREALARAQDAYGELLLEMQERSPQQAALVAPATATWRDVARRLAPGEAFVEYLVSDSTTLAFVITRDTLSAVDLGVGRRDLSRLVEFARGTIERRVSGGGDVWRVPLQRLRELLVAPLEERALPAGTRRLVIVPHLELHYLPFAALLDTNQFLMERYVISTTPSATVWLALGDRPNRHPTGALALAARPDVLPASALEVAAVERLAGPGVRVATGVAASEEVFRRDAPGRRVLHLATYGVLNKRNPLFSYVELARGGPFDGRLEVHEVYGLSLSADLVVLSACQTGIGSGTLADVPVGDDWVGLTRAFLHAGAATVIATLWPVDDLGSAALMERFYGSYRTNDDPAVALALAQRSMAAGRATANPYFWAGYVSVSGHR